jgi:hypothetical protein
MSRISKQSRLDSFFGTGFKDSPVESLPSLTHFAGPNNHANGQNDSKDTMVMFQPALNALHLPPSLSDDYFSMLLEFFHFSITFGYSILFRSLYTHAL